MKKYISIIIIIFLSIIFIPSVNATDGCSSSDFSEISKRASAIKFEIKYIGKKFDDEYGIYIYGMSDDFHVEYNGNLYSNNDLIDGLKAKQTYKLNVLNNNLACSYKLNYSRNITMPAYNNFLNSEYCDNDDDIPYCEISYDSAKLTEEKFKELIDDYYDKQNAKPEVIENNNALLYGIIGGAVLLVIIIIVIILKSKKKKVL